MQLLEEADDLKAALACSAVCEQKWDSSRFIILDVLQAAPRNSGHLELLEDVHSKELVVAKVMPLSWTCGSHEEFLQAYPDETEKPWRGAHKTDLFLTRARDACVTQYLAQRFGESSHVCKFFGIFRRTPEEDEGGGRLSDLQEASREQTCFVLSYCAGGDLFTWLERSLASTDATLASRELLARPLMYQTLKVVCDVHSHGISHGDLSLENILLHTQKVQCSPDVRLVDFACSDGYHAAGPRGKSPYQAPEMHSKDHYCAFDADVFALGVVIFTLVVGNYPWKSTRPNSCQFFRYFKEFGLQAFLARRRVNTKCSGLQPLSTVLSHEIIGLLQGLLCVDPTARLRLPAALEHQWFEHE